MSAPENTYALILAGGSGTRFWPLSRNTRPKQLLDLFGNGTLLEHAIHRLEGLVPLENILILTNALQADAVRATASMLPAANIFAEPAKRDTAPAVALGIGLVAARNEDAVGGLQQLHYLRIERGLAAMENHGGDRARPATVPPEIELVLVVA